MRASDTERQRVIDELRRHCAAGRLDVDEYASRIEGALAATTLEDLDRVLGDLPMLRIADPSAAGGASPNGAHRQLGGRAGRFSGPTGDTGGRGRGARRWAASAVVLVSVLVVLSAVAVALLAGWSWAAVLLGGWLLGLLQSRLAGRGVAGLRS